MSSEKIEQFCQITGSTNETAATLLSACNDDLEMAISLYMDDPNSVQLGSPNRCRSPIPRRTEQLLPVELPVYINHTRRPTTRSRRAFHIDDSDISSGGSENGDVSDSGDTNTRNNLNEIQNISTSTTVRTSRQNPTSSSRTVGVADMINGVSTSHNGPSSSGSTDATRNRKRSFLHQLYQPPEGLLFDGSLASALGAARKKHQWLLISLHDEGCFECHLLNRDVWKDPKIFQMVKKNFVFVQIPIDTPDGFYCRRAHSYVDSASHIAILNPFTEEQVVMWVHLKDPTHVHQVLSEFLMHNQLGTAEHTIPSTSAATSNNESDIRGYNNQPPCKRSRLDPLVESQSAGLSARVANVSISDNTAVNSCGQISSATNLLDLSEEEQLRLAIEASKLESINSSQSKPDAGLNHVDDQCEIIDTDEEEDDIDSDCFVVVDPDIVSTSVINARRPLRSALSAAQSSVPTLRKPQPGESSVEVAIRLPGGSREIFQLPTSLTMLDLRVYFEQRGFSSNVYELIRLYPRTCLSMLPDDTTLAQIGLAKKDTLFLQAR